MTKLLDIEVEGLAGRPDPVRLALRSNVNILFGLNGSGKTTLLKILHSALDNHPASVRRAPFESATVRFVVSGDDEIFERRIALHSPQAESQVELDYGDSVDRRAFLEQLRERQASLHAQQAQLTSTRDADRRRQLEAELVAIRNEIAHLAQRLESWITRPALPAGVDHRYLSTNRLITDTLPLRPGASRTRVSDTEIDEVFAGQIETVWRTYTNNVLSTVTDIQSAGYRHILRSLLFQSPSPTDESLAEVQRAYQRAQHFIGTSTRGSSKSEFEIFFKRFQEEPLFRGVVQDIDRIESQIEEAEEPRRRLSELVGSFFSEGKSIRFTNSGIKAEVLGRQIPLAGLSSGEKQLVRILIEVIMTDDGIIIIDEPELSMHIDWQRELVKAMQTVNPAAQIIMATHSPEIMENVPDECIFRL